MPSRTHERWAAFGVNEFIFLAEEPPPAFPQPSEHHKLSNIKIFMSLKLPVPMKCVAECVNLLLLNVSWAWVVGSRGRSRRKFSSTPKFREESLWFSLVWKFFSLNSSSWEKPKKMCSAFFCFTHWNSRRRAFPSSSSWFKRGIGADFH